MSCRRLLVLTASVVLVACAAAGCGGRSQQEWRSAVGRLCATYNQRINGTLEEASADRSTQLGRVVPVFDEFAAQVKSEELPSKGRLDAQAFVNSLEATRAAFSDVAAAARGGDTARSISALRTLLAAGRRSDADARKVGLASCTTATGAAQPEGVPTGAGRP